MVRSKVFYSDPDDLGKKLKRWLKRKKFNSDKIISMSQSSHAAADHTEGVEETVVLTILYQG